MWWAALSRDLNVKLADRRHRLRAPISRQAYRKLWEAFSAGELVEGRLLLVELAMLQYRNRHA